MLKNERYERILEILDENTYVTANELSERLYVSIPTVRRDLTELQRQGLIRRNHGGARKVSDGGAEIPLSFRTSYKQREKKLLCKAAAALVKDGDTVFVDGSTTLLHMSDYLATLSHVTVVTNGIPMAMMLSDRGVKTFCVGGEMIPNALTLAGGYAEEFVRHFNFDAIFFSAYGVSDHGMIVDTALPESMLFKAAMENAKKSIFVCDGDKFHLYTPYNILSLKELDCIVTNTPPFEGLDIGSVQWITAEK